MFSQNVLLATPRGANCRHACASVYSVVVMETETAVQALQTAKNMLNALPAAGSPIDGESSHAVQGMFMGAAYLLERLFSRHVATGTPSALAYMATGQPTGSGSCSSADGVVTMTSTKKSRKEKQQQQKQLRADIIATIEHLVTLMCTLFVHLLHAPFYISLITNLGFTRTLLLLLLSMESFDEL